MLHLCDNEQLKYITICLQLRLEEEKKIQCIHFPPTLLSLRPSFLEAGTGRKQKSKDAQVKFKEIQGKRGVETM